MNKNFKYFLSVFVLLILFFYTKFIFAAAFVDIDRISEDTIWTKDNGPHIISKFTELSEDATLTIGPGTEVKFDDKTDLTILGKLIVNGTEDEPVYFIPHTSAVANRTWGGLSISNDFDNEIKNLVISNAYECLSFYSTTATLENVKVIHCDEGIKANNSSLNISNSEIIDNINGLNSYESNVKIENSTIYNNKEYGILNGDFEYGSPNVKATNNWWGSADGPYYQNFNDEEISSVYNKVSQNVEYDPWLLSEPIDEKILLASSTEYEDDLNNDSKGVANKTIFTFETIYKNSKNIAPDSIYLIIENSDSSTSSLKLSLEDNNEENFVDGEKYFATSTFSKGNYIYYFEAKSGDTIIKSATSSIITGYSNVAFLPGLEASKLYVNENGEEKRIWQPSLLSDSEYLSLDENGNSIKSGIYTKDVIDYAYVLAKGNIYRSFISNMNDIKDEGLIKDWAAIPYDWRMSVEEVLNNGYKDENGNIYYFDNQTDFSNPYILSEIKRLAENSDTGKVNIVTHSNGGLVTKELTKRLGDEASKLIENIIFVAVPQVGTPQAIGSLLHGFDEGLPIKMFPIFFTASEARNLGKNMASAYGLIPSGKYFDSVSTPVISFVESDFLKNWIEKYGKEIKTSSDLYNFIFDNDREVLETKNELSAIPKLNKKLYDQAINFHNEVDNWEVPEGVTLIEIAGWGEKTLSGIEYYQGIKTECVSGNDISNCTEYNKTQILEYKPKLIIDGDGTVVVPSALATPVSERVKRYWVDLQSYDTFLNLERNHADILEVSELNDFIKNIISEDYSLLPKYISSETLQNNSSDESLVFSLHSPLTLDLYDEYGNHTGISTTTNEVEENIPGSRYLEFGELKYIFVPKSTKLDLSMTGYSSGSFTLNIDQYEGDNIIASTTFAGIPSATGTIVTTTILDSDIASSSPLIVDMNGDGKSEISLIPKVNEIVEVNLTEKKTGHRRIIYTENQEQSTTSDEIIIENSNLQENEISIIENIIQEVPENNIVKNEEVITSNSANSLENNFANKIVVKNEPKNKTKEQNKITSIKKEEVKEQENLSVASVGIIEENSLFNKIILFVKKTFTRIFSR